MHSAIQSLLSRILGFVRKRDPAVFGHSVHLENHASASPLAIVGLVMNEPDRRLLAGLGSRNEWKVSFAETLDEASALSEAVRAPAVLCDRDMCGKDWRAALERLSASPHGPCVLLMSAVVDDYLWNEVIRRGGYDVLAKPLREEDVLRTIKLARSFWNTKKSGVRAPNSGSLTAKK